MKYLFFDIDGTLLSHSEGISQSTIEALNLAKEKGHKIFICTGRSYAEIPKKIYEIADFDGVIAAAGGYIKYEGEVIFNKLMPEHLIDNMVYFFNKLDLSYVLEGVDKIYSHKDGIYRWDKIEKELKEILDETNYEHAAYYYRLPKMLEVEEYFKDRREISKSTVYAKDESQLIELAKYIDNDFNFINYGVAAEVVAKGINKFTGIQEVLKYANADIKDTYSFGDSLNDYDMIENANTGVAMGNASEEVKAIADYVTTSVENDGIMNALKHFELI